MTGVRKEGRRKGGVGWGWGAEVMEEAGSERAAMKGT